ncbi:MAG: RluA family pseudouridine synthase [Oscillospiraceae bacterium]|nr:RluA family pseudouridine synthase [Oscillospiraceae bacterium]
MEILYQDRRVLVCVKPVGVLSTDEPGGVPELARAALGDEHACVRTVHRLDRVVGGLMLLARSRMAASILGAQVRAGTFEKEYLAVLHGAPDAPQGTLRDFLHRDMAARKSYVVAENAEQAQLALLHYQVLCSADGLSLVKIRLQTGRTHQIRVQFSARGMPLVGDRKYGADDGVEIALWSCALRFAHPETGENMTFYQAPPRIAPWTAFEAEQMEQRAAGQRKDAQCGID